MSNADTIRRAIMCSLYNTGRTIEGVPYSHEDYDAAHAALNELVTENLQLRDALERIDSAGGVETRFGGQIAGAMKEIARTALDGTP